MSTTVNDESSVQTAQFLLSLARLKGVRTRKALELFDAVADRLSDEDPRDLFLALANEHSGTSGAQEMAWGRVLSQLADCQDRGVQVIPYSDERYPRRLKQISDPPVVLFVKGETAALHSDRSVAIVGTRKPTDFGERAAEKAGRQAAESGIVVVSGLALGCDTKAHEGCVAANGSGVAVLAQGLDKVYPAANRSLANRILDCGGCLVSEVPVGVHPTRLAFIYRDRIQSGLSDSVLVIETDVKGGTMHTVGFSQKQHRPLACIDHPQSFHSMSQAQGNRALIAQGIAIPIPDEPALARFYEGIEENLEKMPEPEPKASEAQMGMTI